MKKERHGSLKSYILGFLLSIVLTLIAFYFVMQHDQSHHMIFSHEFLIILILILAFFQMLVQLFFFLHLGKKGQSPMNLIVLISFMSIILIVIVASIWIMQHLNYNMSLIKLNNVMKNGEGF